MSAFRLRLRQIPEDILNLRKFAPRADGADWLPVRITSFGFAGNAQVGDEVDFTAVADAITGTIDRSLRLPPEIELVGASE